MVNNTHARRSLWAIAVMLALTAPQNIHAQKDQAPRYARVLTAEAASKSLCEAHPQRVFIKHRLGSECIAYFVTHGQEASRRAVVFLEGDVVLEKMDEESQAKILAGQQKTLQRLADTMSVRFIAISRPGVLGSSGNHGDRRKPAEMLSMNAAVDAIKARLGVDEIALAGQSGGSSVAAALLTMGRTDIACAVLGSGRMAVIEGQVERAAKEGRHVSLEALARTFYDPSRHIDGIVRDPRRHIFVLGDPNDQNTPFPQQQRFGESLAARGHHARVVIIAGTGDKNHGATHRALPAAAMCASGVPEAQIVARATQPMPPAVLVSKPAIANPAPASPAIDTPPAASAAPSAPTKPTWSI